MTRRVSRIAYLVSGESILARARARARARASLGLYARLLRTDTRRRDKGRVTRGKYAKQEAVCQVRAIFTSLIGHFPRSRDPPRDSARQRALPAWALCRTYLEQIAGSDTAAEPACLRLRCNTLRIHNAPRVRAQRARVETRVPPKSRSSATYTGCVSPCRSGGVACGMGDGMAERIDRRSRFANESASVLSLSLSLCVCVCLFLEKKLELGNGNCSPRCATFPSFEGRRAARED